MMVSDGIKRGAPPLDTVAVKLPGDKRQKIRLRNTKTASGEVKKRLKRNLAALMEEPRKTLPIEEFSAEDRKKGVMRKTVARIEEVIERRNDRRWLLKRVNARRYKGAPAAYISGFLAALGEDFGTVMTFALEPFGRASFVRRGDGDASKMAALQNHDHPALRLLLWEDLSRGGVWFFSTKDGVICTGRSAEPPGGWLEGVLGHKSIPFSKSNDGKWMYKNRGGRNSPLLTLEISGQKIEVNTEQLGDLDKPLIHLMARRMLPPRVGSICSVDVAWKPAGWGDEELPEEACDAIKEACDAWLDLRLGEEHLGDRIRAAVLDNIDHGFLVGERWVEDKDGFLTLLQGHEMEIELLGAILDDFGNGWSVEGDGQRNEAAGEVIRVRTSTCHSLLKGLWKDIDPMALADCFGVSKELAEQTWLKHVEGREGTGALLRRMKEQHDNVMLKEKFSGGGHSEAANVMRNLVLTAISEGMTASIGLARKRSGGMRTSAIGWAWLNVIGRTKGQEWGFEEDARRLGEAWVDDVQGIWESSERLNEEEGDDEQKRFNEAMEKFCELVGQVD